MEGGKMVTVKIVPFSMPLSHVWEGLGGKFEGGNVKLLEGRRSHWSGLWCPHVRYFTFEGRQRKMPSVSGFHSVGRQCIRVVRGTTFVLIVVIVQWPICVRLIATMWTTACQASLSLPFPGFAQVHVHWIGDAIQLSHSLTPFSPSSLGLSQHQKLSNELSVHIRWPEYWSFIFSFMLIQTFIWIPTLLLTGCGSLGKSFTFSVSISSSLNGDNNSVCCLCYSRLL